MYLVSNRCRLTFVFCFLTSITVLLLLCEKPTYITHWDINCCNVNHLVVQDRRSVVHMIIFARYSDIVFQVFSALAHHQYAENSSAPLLFNMRSTWKEINSYQTTELLMFGAMFKLVALWFLITQVSILFKFLAYIQLCHMLTKERSAYEYRAEKFLYTHR